MKEYNKIVPNIKVEFQVLSNSLLNTLTDLEWANSQLVERLNILEAQLEDYRDTFADMAKAYSDNLCKKANASEPPWLMSIDEAPH